MFVCINLESQHVLLLCNILIRNNILVVLMIPYADLLNTIIWLHQPKLTIFAFYYVNIYSLHSKSALSWCQDRMYYTIIQTTAIFEHNGYNVLSALF